MWRLVVFQVPDRLGGLLSRLGFKQSKKNPHNWSRIFYPERGRGEAEKVREELKAAGLSMKWYEVTADARIDGPPKKFGRR